MTTVSFSLTNCRNLIDIDLLKITMTFSRSRSPARARSASPRRSPSTSQALPASPYSDSYDGEDDDGNGYDNYDYDDDEESGAQDRELTHEEKVRRCLADSPSPTGSPVRQDE